MLFCNKQISVSITSILILTTFSIFLEFPISPTSGDLINPLSLMSHGTIHIDGNDEFTFSNGVLRGTGIRINPF